MRLRFRLRSLLILTALVALLLTLLVHWRNGVYAEADAVVEIEKLGGDVDYDYEFDAEGLHASNRAVTVEPPGPQWLKEQFGANCLAHVSRVWLQNHDVPAWKHRPAEDVELALLVPLPRLRELHLDGASITDDGLRELARHAHLEKLHLSGTKITDEGLRHLVALPRLRELNISGTKITDAAFEHLNQMPQLRMLYLGGTAVTDAAEDAFAERHPGCDIWGNRYSASLRGLNARDESAPGPDDGDAPPAENAQ